MARIDGPLARAARLARDRHPLPVGHAAIRSGATIQLTERGGKPLTLEVETLGFAALNSGPGYGGDPSWNHGQWTGRSWIEGEVYDMTDPAVARAARRSA